MKNTRKYEGVDGWGLDSVGGQPHQQDLVAMGSVPQPHWCAVFLSIRPNVQNHVCKRSAARKSHHESRIHVRFHEILDHRSFVKLLVKPVVKLDPIGLFHSVHSGVCCVRTCGCCTEIACAVNSTAQYSSAQHSTAQHSTAQHRTAQHSTAQHSTVQHSTPHHTTPHHTTAQLCTAQHSTAQHSTAMHSTAHHTTPRHTTPHHTTAQHSTEPNKHVQRRPNPPPLRVRTAPCHSKDHRNQSAYVRIECSVTIRV
jgi:hypothetical protein